MVLPSDHTETETHAVAAVGLSPQTSNGGEGVGMEKTGRTSHSNNPTAPRSKPCASLRDGGYRIA